MNEFERLLRSAGGVFTTEQAALVGLRRKALTRAVRADLVERIGRGVYASFDPERQPSDTFRLRVIGALRRRHPSDAASHHAALAMYGVPCFGVSVHRVDVDSHTKTHRIHGRLWVHPWTPGVERWRVDGTGVVDLAVACVQVAATAGFESGVVAMDAALHAGQVTRSQLDAAVRLCWEQDGIETAVAAVRFADRRIESVGESRTRIILSHNGFDHTPQVRIWDAHGFVGRVDFLVEGRVIVEFDGEIKYSGEDADEVRAAEWARQKRLEDLGYRVVRLKWSDLEDPEAVVRRIRDELALAAA